MTEVQATHGSGAFFPTPAAQYDRTTEGVIVSGVSSPASQVTSRATSQAAFFCIGSPRESGFGAAEIIVDLGKAILASVVEVKLLYGPRVVYDHKESFSKSFTLKIPSMPLFDGKGVSVELTLNIAGARSHIIIESVAVAWEKK